MVVTVHVYPIIESKTGQQSAEHLCKTLEALGATKIGNFTVECESFSCVNSQRILNIFHDSDYPASCFSILDNGISLVSDTNFDGLMTVLSNVYQPKKAARMEAKGPKYRLGDFTVKVASVSLGSSFRGLLVEVGYAPCSVPAYCWELLREFMGYFMLPPRDPHQYLQGKMNDLYVPLDTIHQYNEHFNAFRKVTQVK